MSACNALVHRRGQTPFPGEEGLRGALRHLLFSALCVKSSELVRAVLDAGDAVGD